MVVVVVVVVVLLLQVANASFAVVTDITAATNDAKLAAMAENNSSREQRPEVQHLLRSLCCRLGHGYWLLGRPGPETQTTRTTKQ